MKNLLRVTAATTLLSIAPLAQVTAVTFHVGDGSIDGSLCVGSDCVASESFGFDTFRLKENNLRIHFDDTSVSAGFPNNDWRIVINDSNTGGAEYFAIEDSSASRQVFRVQAGARANALVVDNQGDVGLGTLTPALDLDIVTGNTPSIRLAQDGSAGFTAQTWDVAGNEAGFFIRDATNGSTLPIRIRPGAPSSAIDIAGTTDRVGIFNSSPQTDLHIKDGDRDKFSTLRLTNPEASAENWDIRTTTAGGLAITKAGTGKVEFEIDVDGNFVVHGDTFSTLRLKNPNGAQKWDVRTTTLGGLAITKAGTGKLEFEIDVNGNVTVRGNVTVAGNISCTSGNTINGVACQ